MIDRVGDRRVLAGDFEGDIDDRQVGSARFGHDIGSDAVAAARRCGSGSVATIGRQPIARSAWMSRRPIGPHPNTPADMPPRAFPRSSAWIATPSGSRSTAAAVSTEFGERQQEVGRPGKERAQSAVGVAEAKEADVRAEVPPTRQAELAALAGVSGIDRHAEAATRAGGDDPGDLVPEDQCVPGNGPG